MPDAKGLPDDLPDRVRKRLSEVADEVDHAVAAARSRITTRLPGPIAFEYTRISPLELISPAERAQSVSFITRYEHLPVRFPIEVVKANGRFRIGNLGFLRHALNDYRPLIKNQGDSVYFSKLHATWERMLARRDAREGLRIRALDTAEQDVTPLFLDFLGQHKRALTRLVNQFDYDYLYNGVLQHSDASYSERLVADYTSGDLNYVFVKHVLPLRTVHKWLEPWYRLAVALTFPKLGPL